MERPPVTPNPVPPALGRPLRAADSLAAPPQRARPADAPLGETEESNAAVRLERLYFGNPLGAGLGAIQSWPAEPTFTGIAGTSALRHRLPFAPRQTAFLAVCRMADSTLRTVDHQIVDLSLVGVQQYNSAACTTEVNRVGAGDQDRRRGQNVSAHGQVNNLEIYTLAL